MHIKYRPKTLDEVVGNHHIKKVLKSEALHRPFLFVGETGTGKTTLCYIVSSMFGAEPHNVEDLNCVHISKIEDMRGRIEDLFSPSLFSHKRVLILDEIHELSHKSQEVLLKPLEILPDNILILASTTEMGKMKDTLLGRFKILRTTPLTYEESVDFLSDIAKKEEIDIDNKMLSLIVRKCSGLPRKMLVELSILRHVDDLEEAEKLIEMDRDESPDILSLFKLLLVGRDWDTIRAQLDKVLREESPSSIRTGLLNLIGARLMSKYFDGSITKGNKLIDSYTALASASFPEKASLIVGVYNAYLYLGS